MGRSGYQLDNYMFNNNNNIDKLNNYYFKYLQDYIFIINTFNLYQSNY